MKPTVPEVLTNNFMTTVMQILPAMGESYEQRSLLMMAMLSHFSAQDYDRAAAVRVAEIASLRRLFADAARILPAGAFARELEKAGADTGPGLTISELDGANNAARELLIRLMDGLETRKDSKSRKLLLACWQSLSAAAEKRRLQMLQLA